MLLWARSSPTKGGSPRPRRSSPHEPDVVEMFEELIQTASRKVKTGQEDIDNHYRRHEISLTHSFMSVGGGVGVDEDTGATCLVPGAHLTVDGPASIVCLFT